MAAEADNAGPAGAAIPGPGPSSTASSGSGPAWQEGGAMAAMGDAYYRDLYTSEPDFRELARQDKDFAAVIKGNGQLDFSDPAAVMQLTKTLLGLDFGLRIELPEDRLCPPVLSRHNYILWLKGLLDSTSYAAPGGKQSGLDIGTGASCIYPLLGCTQRPWCFVDIDSKSLSYARKNVELNGLQGRIRLVLRKPSDTMIPLDELGVDSVDFVMTNPPFYVSEEELATSAANKARPPSSACTGAPVEMVCDGGEVAFVGRILEESLVLRGRTRWYTSMLGKASSLEVLVGRLREEKIGNYAVTEFVQGSKTRRWALAWSFGPMRPAPDVARGMQALAWRRVLPDIVEATVMEAPITAAGSLAGQLQETVGSLELISWEWDGEKLQGTGRARENVWGRAWRRKKLRQKSGQAEAAETPADAEGACALGFSVAVHAGRPGVSLLCRWREGHDRAIFESFCGFLKSRVKYE